MSKSAQRFLSHFNMAMNEHTYHHNRSVAFTSLAARDDQPKLLKDAIYHQGRAAKWFEEANLYREMFINAA